LGQPEKTFCMADEEISACVQTVIELVDETFLFGLVEIDHDVPAEDDVVAARKEFGFPIMEVELDELLQLWASGVLIPALFEIAEAAGVIHGFHLLLGVETFLACAQAGIADVRRENFQLPGRRDQRLR